MSRNTRGELYRNTRQGKIKGVCAGIADYFGWEAWLVRVLVVSGVLLGLEFFIVVYIAAIFILDKKPLETETHQSQYHRHSAQQTGEKPKASAFDDDIVNESIKVKARIWQAGEPPKKAFYDIKAKFTSLEKELRTMERYVTSPEFTISREINNL